MLVGLAAMMVGPWAVGTAEGGIADPAAAAAGPDQLQVLTTFDDYANGSLRGQGPWSVNVPGATDGAIASDDVPAWMSGKALVNQLVGSDSGAQYRGNASAALGNLAIPEGATGTVFFELGTTRLARTNLHLGLSADPSPGLGLDTTDDPYDLADFGPEVTLGPRGLVARDGGVERPLTGVDVGDNAGYRVWLNIDNATDSFSVHAAPRGGKQVLLTSNGRTRFSFRTAGSGNLVTFLHLNDADDVPSADSYLDTIAVAPTGTDLSDPSPAYAAGWDFENLSPGRLGTRDGWASSYNVRVTADPSDPTNRAVRVAKGDQGLRRPVSAIADGATGTTFLRMRRTDDVNLSAGLSDVDDAAAVTDFRSQLNSQGGSALSARDGAGFAGVGSWRPNAWQCFWVVSDNAADEAAVYSRGGPYRTTTRLPQGSARSFGFRSPTDQPLDRFLLLATSNPSPVLVDDVNVDPTHANLRVPSGRSQDCPFNGSAQDRPVQNPSPARDQPARLTLDLKTVAQLPRAGTDGPVRRINTVVPVPGLDRVAVPSLDGALFTMGRHGENLTTYLDVADRFPDFVDAPSLGTGFGYVAYAPDFATSGKFYTVHTEAGAALQTQAPTLDSPDDTQVQGVVTEWTATDPRATTFSGVHRQVLRIGFSRFTHGIQEISFNPLARPGDADYGALYIGTGDGDETPFFSSRPSRLDAPQGKVLRIFPQASNGRPYTVPADNPYVGSSTALPEVYASGLRNPHRFSWDPVTGRLILGNIGEKRVDSIYDVRPGDRFGWNTREGHFRFDPADPTNVYPLPKNDRGFTYPVLQVGRDAGTSLVSGFAYQGRLTNLRGHYLFGDIVSGALHETSTGLLNRGLPEPGFHAVDLVVDGKRRSLLSLVNGSRVDLRLGQDARGELFLLSKQLGRVWRVTGAHNTAPGDAACTPRGVTLRPQARRADWAPLHPSRWSFNKGIVRLKRAGRASSGPRRPWEYAIVRSGPAIDSFDLRAQVRLDQRTKIVGRDVVLVFSYTGARSFAYVHLSSDTASYAHNGIFVVDHADRRRVDDQFNGTRTPAPAIRDRAWHKVRVRHCARTGETVVYVDGAKRPIFTSSDSALGRGRIGFGSYDDTGRIREVRVKATKRG